jgi:hypothetical protein
MPEEVVPFNAFVGVHRQHLPEHVLNLRVHAMRKHQRVLLNLLEQVNDVGSGKGNSKSSKWYFPNSNS